MKIIVPIFGTLIIRSYIWYMIKEQNNKTMKTLKVVIPGAPFDYEATVKPVLDHNDSSNVLFFQVKDDDGDKLSSNLKKGMGTEEVKDKFDDYGFNLSETEAERIVQFINQ